MAINIFSGGSGGKSKTQTTRQASQSTRAKQARSSLSNTAEVSSSGNTAVESKGTLSKVGNFIGKAAGVASKVLPGLGGTIASVVSNLFNDPEWWQTVPGDALSLNETLRPTELGNFVESDTPVYSMRSAILEFVLPCSRNEATDTIGMPLVAIKELDYGVITPTERMITQYLMPEIRKVVNAIPLQSAQEYSNALCSGATIYALWRQLKKIDYMCKHGQTYLASMNQPNFPLFQTENAAWLQSTINRLEEYLRANVRLPHTLCEYLAWRFGRVYKSNDSVKSALVVYNAIPFCADPSIWDQVILDQMNIIAADPATQKANTDLYNTYYDHDYLVEIRDDTQFKFDKKEFMLRLNLSGGKLVIGDGSIEDYSYTTTCRPKTAIDSSLDNPTAFMASTVSQVGADTATVPATLFPVSDTVIVHVPVPEVYHNQQTLDIRTSFQTRGDAAQVVHLFAGGVKARKAATNLITFDPITYPVWMYSVISMDVVDDTPGVIAMRSLVLSKAVDLYNFVAWIPAFINSDTAPTTAYFDVSALSIDAGAPTLTTIATEHVYAFANLVSIERKHSLSYKQAEHLVARDVANMVDSIDVAARASN